MSEENKKYDVGFEDGKLSLGFDSNQDGEKVASIKLNLGEAIQEIFSKGGKIEGAKVAAFEFSKDKLLIKVDSDQDGEELAEIEISLLEAIDEAGLLK